MKKPSAHRFRQITLEPLVSYGATLKITSDCACIVNAVCSLKIVSYRHCRSGLIDESFLGKLKSLRLAAGLALGDDGVMSCTSWLEEVMVNGLKMASTMTLRHQYSPIQDTY